MAELVKSCPVGRQTLLFSATMNTKVDDLASLALNKVWTGSWGEYLKFDTRRRELAMPNPVRNANGRMFIPGRGEMEGHLCPQLKSRKPLRVEFPVDAHLGQIICSHFMM